MKSRIYLMGFMGCGKTTLGKKLSRRLELDFYDLDDQIEGAENRTIPEIFEQDGEAYFRKAERRALEQTAELKESLIALGGGTPCFGTNMEWIKKHGLAVYLQVPETVLYGRLKMLKRGRPLLENLNDEALKSYIADTMSVRAPFYEQADLVIDTSAVSLAEIEKKVVAALAQLK